MSRMPPASRAASVVGPWSQCIGDATCVRVPGVAKPINCGSKERAALIVRAVNSHADLLAALQGVVRVADRNTDEFNAARAAIARATGERK